MKYRIFRLGAPHQWFDVSGKSPEECRAKADRECSARGWDEARSERIESNTPFRIMRNANKGA